MTYFEDWVDKNEKYLSVCNLALIPMEEKQWKVGDLNVNKDLSVCQRYEQGMLSEHFDCLVSEISELNKYSEVNVEIKTKVEIPVHKPPYRVSMGLYEIIEKHVQQMLNNGVSTHSESPYASPAVLVRKPDDTWRSCVDFKNFNKKVFSNSYPIPRVEDLIMYLGKAKYIFCWFKLNIGILADGHGEEVIVLQTCMLGDVLKEVKNAERSDDFVKNAEREVEKYISSCRQTGGAPLCRASIRYAQNPFISEREGGQRRFAPGASGVLRNNVNIYVTDTC
ncbi:hypothetical protein EVAR_38299_1 [Eumeta japonica]|uniref:Uncharacterized protein n=1 Tax=Eumeta variegata TaxID=151549 RepID=A0A4C1WAL2_EUMVA|nr:hypothetical protein EVAR_38299_1 [Eumeta japonica]